MKNLLMGTHNLCFGFRIRKIVYPCKPQFYYIKLGFYSWICFPDVTYISGNGYIEDKELDGFLVELVTSVNAVDLGPEVGDSHATIRPRSIGGWEW